MPITKLIFYWTCKIKLGVPGIVTLLEFIAGIFSSLTIDYGIIAELWPQHTRLIKFGL